MTAETNNVLLMLLCTILSISMMLSNFFSNRNKSWKSKQSHPILSERLLRLLTAYFAVVSVALCAYSMISMRDTKITSEDDLSSQIITISNNLYTSSNELINIQKELENRIITVQELKKEAEIAENVISLTTEQVNAIQAKLNQELEQSNRKNTFTTIIVSTVFFGLGFVVNPIYNMIKRKRNKKAPQILEYDSYGHSKEDIELALKMFDAVRNVDKD